MIRIPANNECSLLFSVDETKPFGREGSHRYCHADLVNIVNRSVPQVLDGRKIGYIFVEGADMQVSSHDYMDWYQKILNQKLPKTIIYPEVFSTVDNCRPCFIAKLSGGVKNCHLLKQNHNQDWSNYPLLFKLYRKGFADAKSVNLTPYGFFINLRDQKVFVDTMPGKQPTVWNSMDSLERYFDQMISRGRARSTSAAVRTFSASANIRRQVEAGQYGVTFGSIQMMVAVTEPPEDIYTRERTGSKMFVWTPGDMAIRLAGSLPTPQYQLEGKTSRKVFDWTPDDKTIHLGDLLPTLPNLPFLLVSYAGDGSIQLKNLTQSNWTRKLVDRTLIVKPGEIMTPQAQETISLYLPSRIRINMTVQGFPKRERPKHIAPTENMHAGATVAPHAPRDNQAQTAAPVAPRADATKVADGKKTDPDKLKAPATRTEVRELEDLYDYDGPKLPPPNHSIPAVELATCRRVMLEHLSDIPAAQRDALMEQKNNPIQPVAGLCGMVRLHSNKSNDDIILVREAPQSNGWYSANSPALRGISMDRQFLAAEAMLRLLANVQLQKWLPTRIIETHMLVHPQKLEARFEDGAWLARENRVPLECTLGYRAPQAYEPAHLATEADISFCVAVWLYRLLIGGYPMEGAATRRLLAESEGASEEALAPRLYGEAAKFVFDPNDKSNAIDGLGGAFDDQSRRWDAMPQALREGWLHTFSTCLHDKVSERVTLPGWIEILHRAIQKGRE